MQRGNKVFKIVSAERVRKIEEYYFSKKLKEIARMNAAGKKVINLGVGSPDRPPSKEAIDVFCHEIKKPDVHGYQPYGGITELRKSFAEWYRRWFDVILDPDSEIYPLIGSKEGILHISMAFLNPGDGVLIPDPGYPTYTAVSKLVGADVIPYKLNEKSGWIPDFNELERVLDERNASGKPPARLMWVNYPNMPTGADASDELYEQIVSFGVRHNIVVCNDNPYSFILNKHPRSILSVNGAKNICIELNSMSKSHNMPGWRMAMLGSNKQFVQWITKVKSNVDSGQFRPMQSAVIEALNAPREWYDNMNEIYNSRRNIAGQIMKTLDCTYDNKQVGMFLWGKIPDYEKNGEELANKILYEANVFVTPGFIFGAAGQRYIRISLCCKKESLEKALLRIDKIKNK